MSNATSSANHRRPPEAEHIGTVYDRGGNVIKQGHLLAWLDGTDAHANPPIIGGYVDPRRPITRRRYWFAGDAAPTTVDPALGERITIILTRKG